VIPKDIRPGATPQNLNGTTQAFTIKANGKAFRTLIDGLYSNKVRAVIRELCSNAQDSHTEARQTRPFTVQIPTALDPIFRVRDYGTSLSHDDVMHLYTTIFQSTREESNDATGMLGLGSKSPFAYTDSFSVRAYMDGKRRTYLAHLATDGVPALTYVNEEDSDEPRGLEVMFAAKREDIASFQREMQFVSMGYKTPPEVLGMTVHMPKPRMQGTNWAIYPNGSFGDNMRHNHYVRQGSALYPLDRAFPHVGYGFITITDIPIGTADVAASREALSYDRDTLVAINNIHQSAYQELKAQVDAVVAAAKTRVEKARVYLDYNGILDNLRGSTMVSLWHDEDKGARHSVYGDTSEAGEVLEMAEHFGKSEQARGAYRRRQSQFEVNMLDRMKILVNEPEVQVVRRVKRIRNASWGGHTYVLTVTDPKERTEAIKWIKQCLELKDDQFVLVSSLPDDPPPRKPAGAKKARRVLAPDQYWMPRANSVVMSDIYGWSDRGFGCWPHALVDAARKAGIKLDWDTTFFVTEAQQERYEKRGELPEAQRLDVAIKTALEKKVKSLPLDEAQTMVAILRQVGEYNRALPVVMENFFPNLGVTRDQAHEIINMAEMAKIDLQNRPIVAKITLQIKELVQRYPLLFQKSDPDHYRHYVKSVQAAQQKEASK
jgi:hypothetical protein